MSMVISLDSLSTCFSKEVESIQKMKRWKFYYKKIGHALENSFRKYRAYLKPHCYKQYGSVLVETNFDLPLVSVIDLNKSEVLTDSGRYFQGLVKGLLDTGHGVYVVKKLWVVSELLNKRYSRMLLEEEKIQFITKKMLIENMDRVDYLWIDNENSNEYNRTISQNKNTIQLNLSARPVKDKLWMPYQVHPDISILPIQDELSLEKPRSVGVFFIGNVVPAYDSEFVKSHQMMTRIKVLELLINSVSDDMKVIYEKFLGIDENDTNFQKSVFLPFYDIQTKKSSGMIPSDKYIDLLSEIDFVICTPGTYMPFAHNVIEAMSQGCIPIIQYGHYFSPELEDGVNCLVFNDEESLKLAVNRAVELSFSERLRMRKEVWRYYNEHLKFSSFLNKVDILESPIKAFYYA